MLFGNGKKNFTNEIEGAFARFGMKNEQTSKGKSKNTLRMRMYDTIHDSAYTAVAIEKSAGKNIEKVWNDIIENDLIPEALANKSEGGVNAGALIVPSQDIDAVSELLRKKGVAPTVYQLFDGYAVAGLNKQNMGLLVKSAEKTEETKPNEEPKTEKSPETITKNEPTPDLADELEKISGTSKDSISPSTTKQAMPLSKKLAAAALLGVAVGIVPFAAKMVTDKFSTPEATENTAAIQETARYFSDIKNGAPEDIEMLKAIASNPETAQEYLEKLADTPVGIDIVKNPSAPAQTVAKAAKSNSEDMRAAAAENPNTSMDTLQRLLNDKSPKVRAALAKNPAISAEMMSKLAADKVPDVRESLLENMSLPPDILDEVTRDAPRNCETLRKMMANPCITPEMLDYNKDNPNECIRMGVAANPNTSPDTVAKLASDTARDVRDTALKNPQIPEETLRNIFGNLGDKAETVELKADRTAAIANKAINPDVIRKALMVDPENYLKQAASNPRTPQEALAKILERASGKQGLKNFIDKAMNIKSDPKIKDALKKEAAAKGTSVDVPLRNMLNKSFVKDVYDPYKLANEMSDAKKALPNITEYKLTKPRREKGAATTNSGESRKTYSLTDMPEIPQRFTELPLQNSDNFAENDTAATNAALETADAIIDSVMADVLPSVEDEPLPTGDAALGEGGGTNRPDTVGAANASRASIGSGGNSSTGIGASYAGGMLPDERAELLFKNACERIDDLNKIF